MNGRILRNTRKQVEDQDIKQNAYSDDWYEQVSFEYDGPITQEVKDRIYEAIWKSDLLHKGESSWGQLRYRHPDTVSEIDAENKRVLIHCSIGICD